MPQLSRQLIAASSSIGTGSSRTGGSGARVGASRAHSQSYFENRMWPSPGRFPDSNVWQAAFSSAADNIERGTRTVHWGRPALAALRPQASPSSGAREGGQHIEDTVARRGTRCVPHAYRNCAPLFVVLCGAHSVCSFARLREGDAGAASVRVRAAVTCARCGAIFFGGPGREGGRPREVLYARPPRVPAVTTASLRCLEPPNLINSLSPLSSSCAPGGLTAAELLTTTFTPLYFLVSEEEVGGSTLSSTWAGERWTPCLGAASTLPCA